MHVFQLFIVILLYLTHYSCGHVHKQYILHHTLVTGPCISLTDPSLAESVPPKKEPIVLLHGLLGSSRNLQSWSKLVYQKLSGHHDIYLLDLRNHGGSVRLGSLVMDYKAMANDIFHTLNALNIKEFHLIGHSIGGKTAAATALLDSKHGGVSRVKSVSLLDISPISYASNSDVFLEVNETVDFLVQCKEHMVHISTKDDVAELIAKKIRDESLLAFLLSSVQGAVTPVPRNSGGSSANGSSSNDDVCIPPAKVGFEWKFLLDGIEKSMNTICDFPFIDGEDSYDGPCLIYKASKSNFVKTSHLPAIKALFPCYRMIQESDVGHWLHVMKPDETATNICSFIRYADAYQRDR